MKAVEINQAALDMVVNEQDGPVSIEMVAVASRFAADAKDAISIPRPRGQGRHLGNPFLRTGDLMRSIQVENPKIDTGGAGPGLVSYVSFSQGGGNHFPDYPRLLRDGGVNQYGPYGPFRFNSVAVQALLTYVDI